MLGVVVVGREGGAAAVFPLFPVRGRRVGV